MFNEKDRNPETRIPVLWDETAINSEAINILIAKVNNYTSPPAPFFGYVLTTISQDWKLCNHRFGHDWSSTHSSTQFSAGGHKRLPLSCTFLSLTRFNGLVQQSVRAPPRLWCGLNNSLCGCATGQHYFRIHDGMPDLGRAWRPAIGFSVDTTCGLSVDLIGLTNRCQGF